MDPNLATATNVCLTARWILTMTGKPQQGGWIRLNGDRVVEVQPGSPPPEAIDLGDVAILPGLINAHTHLEFSDIAQPIGRSDDGRSDLPLHDWIGQVVQCRQSQTSDQCNAAVLRGWEESVASGVRWLADISTPPMHSAVTTRLNQCDEGTEYCGLAEVIGLSPARWNERWTQADHAMRSGANHGYSPHAPYSTSMAAIQKCISSSRVTQRLMAMHVAESPAERELIHDGTGPFAEALQRMGVWQDQLFPWPNSKRRDDAFVNLIGELAKSWRALLVHGNDLSPAEIETVARSPNLTVVYCPRTHWFFRHKRHPVDQMIDAGIRVALGTDSRASNPDLNLWSEVQFLLNHRQDIAPASILAMPTCNAAEAIGRPDLGVIRADSRPGLATVETAATTERQLEQDLADQPYRPLGLPSATPGKSG